MTTPQELVNRAEAAMKEIDAVLQEAKAQIEKLDAAGRAEFRQVYRGYYQWHHKAADFVDVIVPDEIVVFGGST